MRLTYFYPDLDKEDKRGTPVQVVPLELDGVLSQMLTGLAHLNGCMPEDEIGELFVSMFEAGKNAGT
ncbi:hypothetical protein K8942_00495 [Candidatus Peribacteria bacterium]|nr:MAG: hypothetical protein K8942_00495 [Candidatus Peribacteria bacterium]